MVRITFLVMVIILLVSCSPTTYYIVRHAEKETQQANMSSDVPLSASGAERAQQLKNTLQQKKIGYIYSTNTIRTKTTAQPLSEAIGIPIQTYDPRDTGFIYRVKALPKGNVLIVGHSNTVDDLVNQFYPEARLKDLPDNQYGDLFILKKKKQSYSFTTGHFGR
jgi:broad specificity phosphatase PhoE